MTKYPEISVFSFASTLVVSFGFCFLCFVSNSKQVFSALSLHPSPGRIYTSAKVPLIQSCISQKNNDKVYKRFEV
jgi:hypothetical protein